MNTQVVAEHLSVNQSLTFAVGNSVYLRGCRVGQPGRVVRIERNKVVVLWPDIDYLARHRPQTLVHASSTTLEVSK